MNGLAHEAPLEAPVLDSRRSNRVNSSLWVRIGGLDDSARMRRGNISLTGLYVAVDEPVGSPGDLVWLSLASADKKHSARVMSRIARVVRQDDVRRGALIIGAAFEFLPVMQPQRSIVDLVRHVTRVELQSVGTIVLDRELPASVSVSDGSASLATVHTIGIDRLVVRSNAPLTLGQTRIRLPEATGGFLEIHGEVLSTYRAESRDQAKHTNVIRFDRQHLVDDRSDAREPATSPVEALLCGVLVPSRLPRSSSPPDLDVSGQLSRVQLPSLLALVELEHLTGLITIADDRCAVRIYVRDGRVIDAERDGVADPPHEILGDLLEWPEAEFSIACIPVNRTDRVEMPTTALLLDLVRERDERVA